MIRYRGVADANVLYPFRKRDLLLTFALNLFQLRLSDEIIAEWTTSLISRRPNLTASVKRQEEVIRTLFCDSFVTEYEDLIPQLWLPDENDRHVLAVAIKSGSGFIITENLRDFPEAVLSEFEIAPLSTDAFLSECFRVNPDGATSCLETVRRRYSKPAMSREQFESDLRGNGFFELSKLYAGH